MKKDKREKWYNSRSTGNHLVISLIVKYARSVGMSADQARSSEQALNISVAKYCYHKAMQDSPHYNFLPLVFIKIVLQRKYYTDSINSEIWQRASYTNDSPTLKVFEFLKKM